MKATAQHPEPASPWVDLLNARFGFPADIWQSYQLIRTSDKYLMIASAGVWEPAGIAVRETGIPFLRIHGTYPKLTVWGAMLLGRFATRNYVAVDQEQSEAFLRHEEAALTLNQTQTCTSGGHVIVRHDGVTLGLGTLYLPERRLESLYPRAHALR